MRKDDLKVVLLGHWYCGKTCLVHRYVFNKFIEKSQNHYQPTIGAEYNSVMVKINRRQVKLGLWDTAGEEKYLAITKTYLRSLAAAIICYDLSQFSSFDLVKYWVNEVKKMEESCKIYLCGCKLDLIDSESRQTYFQVASNYGELINAKVFETSSKTGQGINDLFHQIAKDYYNSKSGLTFADNHKTNLPETESSHQTCYC